MGQLAENDDSLFDASTDGDGEVTLKLRPTGRRDSVRHMVLGYVSKDKFDQAIRELRYYQQFKSDLRVFQERTDRYFDHCEALVLAIKSKKSFPNIDSLPVSKKQEIFERVHDHFEELEGVLRRVEQIENDIRIQDSRSTIWVMQSLLACSVVIIIWAVLLEGFRSMGMSFDVVLEDVTNIIFRFFGL